MKRSVLFFALLLATLPAWAAPQNFGVITTRTGQSFYDCKIVRVHPDGVAFTHRDGAAKIPFRELPESLRREFRYDPKAEAQYKQEQAALRKQEKAREKQREIAMQERLMEAQMAEASYLASANTVYQPTSPTPLMATSLPGEPVTVAYQSPSWVGSPIGGSAFGGRGYGRSYWGGYPAYGGYGYGRGYGYGYGGGYYPGAGYGYNYGYPSYSGSYSYPSYGGGYSYPYTSSGGFSYPAAGWGSYGHGYPGYRSPTVYGSWNVGSGVRLGVGLSSFGGGIRLFR